MTFARRAFLTAGFLVQTLLVIATAVLWFQGRVPASLLAFAAIDAALVALLLESWRRTPPAPAPSTPPDHMWRDSGRRVLDFGPSLERARN